MGADTAVSSSPDQVSDSRRQASVCRIALAGNPNCGKTTLFNLLTGLRAQTANFPGTTVERKTGRLKLGEESIEVLDLPGMYSLEGATEDEWVARRILLGEQEGTSRPDAVIVIVDADNLERSLFLVGQLLEEGLPMVVALNMMDLAERHGKTVDPDILAGELGCPVIPMVARAGQGVPELRQCMEGFLHDKTLDGFHFRPPTEDSLCGSCTCCPYQARYTWTENIARKAVKNSHQARDRLTEKIDRYLTHPVGGLAVFLMVMLSVFYLIFSVASVPMDMIDGLFAHAGAWVESWVPPGDLQSLLVNGVIGGVGGVLVFLPQICILFFFLALLDDSGYLARAAFVMDRLMRRIGLPGTAFVPLLSAHACAIPAIMASRVISNKRDRLVTILVLPLMTCSARIPVYAMVTALLFPHDPMRAALVFTGAYCLGILAGLIMAFVFKKTILPGESKPLILELPGYKLPNLRSTLLYTWDRAKVFVQQAGTIILLISIGLWALATYPKSEPPAEAQALIVQAEVVAAEGLMEQAETLRVEASHLVKQEALASSFAGRLGKFIEPVMAPLGFDWRIGIGVVTSFAAREVIVSTLAIVYGMGDEAVDGNERGFYETLRRARRENGLPVFTMATSLSLLVFYVLAMQCLPTQAVTKRETNSWTWAAFQFGYMTVLAYCASLVTYQVLQVFGVS